MEIFQFALSQTTLSLELFQTLLAVIGVVKYIFVMVFWPKSDLSIMHFIRVALKEGRI